MKRLFLTIITLLFLIAACSHNNNPNKWILLSKSKNATLYYTLDRMSKTDTKIVKIWVKTVYSEVNRDDSNVSYSKNMYMLNCGNKTFKINPGFNYSSSDEIVSKTDAQQPDLVATASDRSNREAAIKPESAESGGYIPVIPDSAAGRLYSVACR